MDAYLLFELELKNITKEKVAVLDHLLKKQL